MIRTKSTFADLKGKKKVPKVYVFPAVSIDELNLAYERDLANKLEQYSSLNKPFWRP